MTCREKTSFQPGDPKYDRRLIGLLGRAQQYASAQIKLEQECKTISPVSSKTDEAEERESPKLRSKDNVLNLGFSAVIFRSMTIDSNKTQISMPTFLRIHRIM